MEEKRGHNCQAISKCTFVLYYHGLPSFSLASLSYCPLFSTLQPKRYKVQSNMVSLIAIQLKLPQIILRSFKHKSSQTSNFFKKMYFQKKIISNILELLACLQNISMPNAQNSSTRLDGLFFFLYCFTSTLNNLCCPAKVNVPS